MADVLLTNLPYASPIKPGSCAVRSLTIRSPVAPITETEYVAARSLMETLDRNGAGFLTLVDAWRKIFRRRFWEQHSGQLPQEVQAVRFDADTALVTLGPSKNKFQDSLDPGQFSSSVCRGLMV